MQSLQSPINRIPIGMTTYMRPFKKAWQCALANWIISVSRHYIIKKTYKISACEKI